MQQTTTTMTDHTTTTRPQKANMTKPTKPTEKAYTADSTLTTKTLHEWHLALGHMNYDDILSLQK